MGPVPMLSRLAPMLSIFSLGMLPSMVMANKYPTSSPATPFSPGFDINAVISLAKALPSHSWEFGTAAEALLELYNAPISVYGDHPGPFPMPKLSTQPKDSNHSPSLEYAKEKIVLGTAPNTFSDGDGAVGDPASLGVAGMLLGVAENAKEYTDTAKAQVEYLLNAAPRWPNGAISHRAAVAELW